MAGIVGSMAIEYDFDPEDDLTVSGERTLSVSYLLLDCPGDSVTFRLEEQSEFPVWVLILAAVLVAVIVAVIVIVAVKHRKKVLAK